MIPGIVIAASDARDVQDLRLRVLRSHMPASPMVTPQDDLPGTVHLTARRGDLVVGIVTFFVEDAPHRPGAPAIRFRGMAVDPSEQGRGIGAALIREVLERGRASGAQVAWANGRDSALGFYAGLGFDVVGDRFTDPVSLLPHHVIAIDL